MIFNHQARGVIVLLDIVFVLLLLVLLLFLEFLFSESSALLNVAVVFVSISVGPVFGDSGGLLIPGREAVVIPGIKYKNILIK